MKQNWRLLAAMVFMFLGFFVPTVKVQAEEEIKIIYAQIPAEWENPAVWAWGEDGANAFEAWPGENMIADSANEGWYYSYVPSFVSSVIINANEGTVQTGDLKTEAENAWITIKSAEEADITMEQKTKGDLPKYEAKITIYAKVPSDWTMPCLWAWSAPDGTNAFANWPGQEMTETADGWFSGQVPDWVNSVIVNGKLGEVQTNDIEIEAKDVWIQISDTENYELTYEKPQTETAEEELMKVHAKVPSDWLMPSLWAWSAPDGTNVFANWPGQEMESEGEWYTFSIPTWVNSIIVNGNLGEVQTKDIAVEPKDVWVVISDSENFEVSYEEPEETPPAESNAAETAKAAAEEQTVTKDNSTAAVIMVLIVVVIAVGGVYLYLHNKKQK